MTVIAWDGKKISVDRRMVRGDIGFDAEKFLECDDGTILFSAGVLTRGRELMAWHLKRDEGMEFPSSNKDDDLVTILIVAKPGEGVWVYEDAPFGEDFTKIYPMAWGSGEASAMGAMFNGADSCTACKIAASIHVTCGGEIDTFEVFP